MSTTDPPKELILNIEGPPEETIFSRLIVWCVPADWEKTSQAEVDEVFAQLSPEDDRAVAVVGALVVETAVDALLQAFAPGYKDLEQKREFTLSLKIALAKALRLCPSRLFGAADALRVVRNDFAHSLSVRRFEDCLPANLRSIDGHLRQFNPKPAEGKSPRDQFKTLATLLFLSLRAYTHHVDKLSRFVRGTKESQDAMKTYWTKKS